MDPSISSSDWLVLAEQGDGERFRQMAEQTNAHACTQWLWKAAGDNHVTAVRRLLPFCPRLGWSHALQVAAMAGHERIVSILAPLCDKSFVQAAMAMSAGQGHEACVRHMLDVVDSDPDCPLALHAAAEGGHEPCVELLKKDAKAEESLALVLAAKHGDRTCLDLLLPLSDVPVAWQLAVRLRIPQAVEALAEHVDADQWEQAVKEAEPGTFPSLEARCVARELRDALDGLPEEGAQRGRL